MSGCYENVEIVRRNRGVILYLVKLFDILTA